MNMQSRKQILLETMSSFTKNVEVLHGFLKENYLAIEQELTNALNDIAHILFIERENLTTELSTKIEEKRSEIYQERRDCKAIITAVNAIKGSKILPHKEQAVKVNKIVGVHLDEETYRYSIRTEVGIDILESIKENSKIKPNLYQVNQKLIAEVGSSKLNELFDGENVQPRPMSIHTRMKQQIERKAKEVENEFESNKTQSCVEEKEDVVEVKAVEETIAEVEVEVEVEKEVAKNDIPLTLSLVDNIDSLIKKQVSQESTTDNLDNVEQHPTRAKQSRKQRRNRSRNRNIKK